MNVSYVSLGGLLAVAAVSFVGATQAFAAATAAQEVTKACSQQYQAAKKAGTLPAGEKWTQFLSDCSTRMKTSATGSTGATGASPGGAMGQSSGSAAAPMKSTPPTTTATAGTATRHMTTRQLCNQQYEQARTAGTLAGKKKAVFLSECAASIANDKEDAATVPTEPQSTTANVQVPTVDKNGKPLSPGEIAFRQRIKECSTEWQQEKSAGKLPAGQKWPQFWSACNKNLKHQG